MAESRIKVNESLDVALKRFKKKMQRAGILSEVKRRAHYEKPSEQRKRRLNQARRKMRKLMAEMNR